MSSLKILAIAGAMAAAATVQARAADLGYPPPPALPVVAAPLVDAGGWYLRGDVGASMTEQSTWSQGLSATEQTSTIRSRGFLQKEVGDSAFVGVGAGYKINSWLRGDITVDYHTGRTVNGVLQSSTSFNDAFGAHTFVGQNVYGGGRMSSVVGLVNGYVDLGTWYGITPYVGAGVGLAYNRTRGLTETGGSATIDGSTFAVGSSTIGNSDKTSLAWALMAGVSYDVTQNLKIDLGYRYLHFGESKTGNVNCNPALCTSGPAPGIRFKELAANEFKIGLRWMLNDAAPAPAYAPAPLVRKY